MMVLRKMRTVARLLTGWLLYALSLCVPRNNSVWVFVGWHKSEEREIFADNSKYLFLHVANESKELRAIWIAEDAAMRDILRQNGYESHTAHSLRGALFSMRAGVTIVDGHMRLHNWRYSGRSRIIQLWHGDGIKKAGFNNTLYFGKFGRLTSPQLFPQYEFVTTSSFFIAQSFICPTFNVTMDRVRITGLPRYDVFSRIIRGSRIDVHEELERGLDIARGKSARTILYAPTFRRGRAADSPVAALDLARLDKFLGEMNAHLFISMHPKFGATSWKPNAEHAHITYVSSDYDMYPLLPRFDLVITDYSSISIEFLHMDKPVIFFIYDYDEYTASNGLVDELWQSIPGPRVHSFDELLGALTARDEGARDRDAARKKLLTYPYGAASESVVDEIMRAAHM